MFMKIENLKLLIIENNVPQTFNFKKDGNSITLFYNTSNKIDEIVFGWIKTSYGYYLRKPVLRIKVKDVENIISVFNKHNSLKTFYSDSTIHGISKYEYEFDYSFCEKEILVNEDFFDVSKGINKFYEIVAMPFFERFNTIQQIFEETEKMPIDEMAKFITQPLPQRRMVIKWLCKDIKYQDYVDMVIDYYKSENDNTWKEIELLDNYLKTMV